MAGGPKVAILGAGSVGCFIGGAWAAAGLPVTFIGRPKLSQRHRRTWADAQRLQRLAGASCARRRRLSLRTRSARRGADHRADGQERRHRRGGRARSPRTARPARLVISFQNGVSNVDVLEQGLGGRFEVARGMVPYNVAYLGEGRFHKGVAGDLYAERRAGTRALAEAVGDGPGRAQARPTTCSALAWGKLLINLNNAVNALSGRTLIEELKQRDYRRVFAASMREGLDLLKRAEIEPATVGPVPPGGCRGSSAHPTGCSTILPQALEDRRQGALVDGRRPRRRPQDRGRLYQRRAGARWPSGCSALRRSTARSST